VNSMVYFRWHHDEKRESKEHLSVKIIITRNIKEKISRIIMIFTRKINKENIGHACLVKRRETSKKKTRLQEKDNLF
jgi:hypothetical protein